MINIHLPQATEMMVKIGASKCIKQCFLCPVITSTKHCMLNRKLFFPQNQPICTGPELNPPWSPKVSLCNFKYYVTIMINMVITLFSSLYCQNLYQRCNSHVKIGKLLKVVELVDVSYTKRQPLLPSKAKYVHQNLCTACRAKKLIFSKRDFQRYF